MAAGCRRMCIHVVSHNSDPAHNVHLEFVNLPCLDLPGTAGPQRASAATRCSIPAELTSKPQYPLHLLSHALPLHVTC